VFEIGLVAAQNDHHVLRGVLACVLQPHQQMVKRFCMCVCACVCVCVAAGNVNGAEHGDVGALVRRVPRRVMS
jgi:hypothetical protein